MPGKYLYIILLFLLVGQAVIAQEGDANLEFIENKGQWDKQVLFKGELNSGSFFLKRNGFTVLLHNPEELRQLMDRHKSLPGPNKVQPPINPLVQKDAADSGLTEPGSLRSHAYSMSFVNASSQATVMADKELPSHNNYFIGNDRTKWASDCKIYQGITYKNIYPNVDVRYYSSNGQLKYDIIVHPGGNPSQIALKYDGPEKVLLNNKKLIIKTSVGEVQELAPLSYQFNAAGKTEVNCKYVLGKDNLIRFKVSDYSATSTLVIDPTLVFATFTGSKASNWGFTATPGRDGTFFAGGIVFAEGFPVSVGAFEKNFQGGSFDIGIMKFSANGTNRMYATYLGGVDNETPHSLYADAQGDLVILGRTYSSNFPFFDTVGSPGGADIFVAKLSPGGNMLLGSLRIGGFNNDGVNIEDQFRTNHEAANSLIRNYGDDSRSEVILDGSNNIYVAASTQSHDFPVTPGVFQPVFGGGDQDGVVMKIDPACKKLLFASFLGGSADDAAFVLKVNPSNGDIYVGGATASNNFPGNTTGALQATYQGGICDGFVTIISNDGTTQKKTSFFGTTGSDAIYGIEFDKKGIPYVMGTTTGNWPVTSNVGFSNPGAKQFISKLQPDLSSYIYSTTFGKAAPVPNISPVAFLVDRCENVYVSGWGGWIFARTDPYGLAGTFGMPVTPDAIKLNTDGRDFYFIVIKKNASSLLYGTFYGQNDGPKSISEHVDGGTSRYDQFGAIYQAICANCGGGSITPFPTTPGVWAPRNGTAVGTNVGGCNLAAIKIAFNFAGVGANLRSIIHSRYDSSGCVPLDVLFQDVVRNAKQYIWTFGDGSPDSLTTSYQINHTYNNIGTFTVRLIAIDSNSCNVSDTVYGRIRVRTDKAAMNLLATKLPPCQSLTYRFDNLSVSVSGKPFSNSSFIWDFGDRSPLVSAGLDSQIHSYASPGTYVAKLLMVDTSFCNYPDELADTLRIAPLVKAQFDTVPPGCAPYDAVFNNTSLAGQQFYWDFGDGTQSTVSYPVHTYQNVGTYTITLVAVDSATCNMIDSTKQTIIVSPKPHAAFSVAPIPPQPNVRNIFTNNSSGATHFVWEFGDGDIVSKATMDTVIHQYRSSGTFQACLIAFNEYECADTACGPVEAIINPLLDVPNAFTPGRFGQNSVFRIQGFGITTMTLKIYNRWGQLVFETNNPDLGWDGTYKGNPQPMDVYAYTLEAYFYDGTKTTRKGDITLIR